MNSLLAQLFMFSFVALFHCQCKSDTQVSFNTDNFQQHYEHKPFETEIIPGAERTAKYLPLLSSKKVGIVANQSSKIEQIHLIDSLLALGVDILKVFVPEHGLKGKADAGEKIKDGYYNQDIPLISLYGNNHKPKKRDIQDLDVLVFDLQDVGARFYTYISTLHYVMEACAESNVELILLDRPNPNGYYVDGPVLNRNYKSFVGMHEVPVVYGMTIGEYAQMINGEEWLRQGIQCGLTIVECKNYDHTMTYELPIAPSPNLPNHRSILLYPSLCMFEGTVVSIGRGTDQQFQLIGHPDYAGLEYSFRPSSKPGAKHPKLKNQLCFGESLVDMDVSVLKANAKFELSYLIKYYRLFEDKKTFFDTEFFDLLAGSTKLRRQIINGESESDIRKSWKKELSDFKKIRSKYLLYEDF